MVTCRRPGESCWVLSLRFRFQSNNELSVRVRFLCAYNHRRSTRQRWRTTPLEVSRNHKHMWTQNAAGSPACSHQQTDTSITSGCSFHSRPPCPTQSFTHTNTPELNKQAATQTDVNNSEEKQNTWDCFIVITSLLWSIWKFTLCSKSDGHPPTPRSAMSLPARFHCQGRQRHVYF